MSTTLLALILLGLAAGFGSGGLTWLVYACEDGFARVPLHPMWWPVIGGLVVGAGGLFYPRALGVGYDTIGDLLQGMEMDTFTQFDFLPPIKPAELGPCYEVRTYVFKPDGVTPSSGRSRSARGRPAGCSPRSSSWAAPWARRRRTGSASATRDSGA